jgi:hypothetical protein
MDLSSEESYDGSEEGDYFEAQEEEEEEEEQGSPSVVPEWLLLYAQQRRLAPPPARSGEMMTRTRDDRPVGLLPPARGEVCPTATAFPLHPSGMQLDPLSTNSAVHDVSPHGALLGTLEYNVRHAVERRDEARTAACLTEFYRHFVYLNRPMRRFVPPGLERQVRWELCQGVGPFANPASLGVHQRILAMVLGVCVRQVGVATPTVLSYAADAWRAYEDALFYSPSLALARLLGIGATLCHCKKDASVAYTRFVFEDTSRMREWRNDVLKHQDVVATYISSAEQSAKAVHMLLNNKVYFSNRLRLRRYQAVCIGNPHPEYMCQGGAMHRSHVFKLVEAVRSSLPHPPPVDVLCLMQEAEDIMVYLSAHVNNVHDREVHESLQVDMQIFLYLLQRVLCEMDRADHSDSLIASSQATIASAPDKIQAAYAARLWVAKPDMLDLIKYGVQGDPGGGGSGGGAGAVSAAAKRRRPAVLTAADIVQPTGAPPVVPKVHAWAPPSAFRDGDNLCREDPASEVQRHPMLAPLRFLRDLYSMHHNWSKLLKAPSPGEGDGAGGRVVVDREVFDLQQPYRVLYHCKATGVCAAEVGLTGRAVAEMLGHTKARGRPEARQESVAAREAMEAEVLAESLVSRSHDTGRRRGLKAVLVGPWPVQEWTRLEREVEHYQHYKRALGVEPDHVSVRRMMLLDFSVVTGDIHSQVLGRTYAWVVYVPSLDADERRVLMTMAELKHLAGQDPALGRLAKAALRPQALVRAVAVMKRTCDAGTCAWRVGDNYVSFRAEARDRQVVLLDVRLHTVAETLGGQFPRIGDGKAPDAVSTAAALESILAKCRSNAQYAGASAELAECEARLNEIAHKHG